MVENLTGKDLVKAFSNVDNGCEYCMMQMLDNLPWNVSVDLLCEWKKVDGTIYGQKADFIYFEEKIEMYHWTCFRD